jgi:hypothetical protein
MHKIIEIDFSKRAYNLLLKHGLDDTDKITAYSEYDLKLLRGVGDIIIIEIKERLSELGYSLNSVPFAKKYTEAVRRGYSIEHPLDRYNLSIRAMKGLATLGIKDLAQLSNFYEQDLLRKRHIGYKTIEEIKLKMSEHGYEFKQRGNAIDRGLSFTNNVFLTGTVASSELIDSSDTLLFTLHHTAEDGVIHKLPLVYFGKETKQLSSNYIFRGSDISVKGRIWTKSFSASQEIALYHSIRVTSIVSLRQAISVEDECVFSGYIYCINESYGKVTFWLLKSGNEAVFCSLAVSEKERRDKKIELSMLQRSRKPIQVRGSISYRKLDKTVVITVNSLTIL